VRTSQFRRHLPVLALALVLAGCASSRATSKFVARANAICTNADKQIEAIATPKAAISAYVAAAREEIPIVQAEISRLATLKPPRGERAPFAQAIADARADVSLAAEMISALKHSDEAKLGAILERSKQIDASTRTETALLGVKDCGRDS
jgi:outer membrane PBP1 activator LpoA protein